MENGKVLQPIVGHGEMAWVEESTIGREGHRMLVGHRIYTVSKVRHASDEVSLEKTSAGFGSCFDCSLEVWRAGALWSRGWIAIGGGPKDKGRPPQLLCVDLSVYNYKFEAL